MHNLTLAWLLLSFPTLLLGAVFFWDKSRNSTIMSAWIASLVFFMPIWWAFYFIIR